MAIVSKSRKIFLLILLVIISFVLSVVKFISKDKTSRIQKAEAACWDFGASCATSDCNCNCVGCASGCSACSVS